MQRDSKNERFEDMGNGTIKYPVSRFGGHLTNRISGATDIRFTGEALICGFTDFMTYSRQSLGLRIFTVSPNRIRGEPVAETFKEADTGQGSSVFLQQNSLPIIQPFKKVKL
ncbi:traA domain protein [Bacteroides fragilis str. S23L17]|nr:traA domain protein [Bacteroides fragilis str. S23L17]